MKIEKNVEPIKSNEFLKELSFCRNDTNSYLRKLLPQENNEILYDAINYEYLAGVKDLEHF